MSTCDHNCNDCSSNTCSTKGRNLEFMAPLNKYSKIKHVIGVMSGKGGVGKSSVASMLAVNFHRMGYKVGVLDADITGPSIPKAFGVHKKALSDEKLGIVPVESKGGIKIMSINAMLENEDDPVIWRGPLLGNVVKQFWTDVHWGELDYLFVDMPPGTGDVTLTVFQSIPLDGIVIVTSPQGLVSLIVKKAYKMAQKMSIPVFGIVENYSFVECPKCGEKINVFGESHIEDFAKELGLDVLAKMPIDPEVSERCDNGTIEDMKCSYLKEAAEKLAKYENEIK